MKCILNKYDLILWDFDGTIKDTSIVKSDSFVQLFRYSDERILQSIRRHHEDNGGMSRYEKIPLYLVMAGMKVTDNIVKQYCEDFASLAFKGVVESPWVPGVKEYIFNNYDMQDFIMISATPVAELKKILKEIGVLHCFKDIIGYPYNKETAVSFIKNKSKEKRILFIGDSKIDFLAAKHSKIDFFYCTSI
jgi:phosphoglycolate phosphatase-like HAD superfamily hydrolase